MIRSIQREEWPIFSGRLEKGDRDIENEDAKRKAFTNLGFLLSIIPPPATSKEVQTFGGVVYKKGDLCSQVLAELEHQEAVRLQQLKNGDGSKNVFEGKVKSSFLGWSMQEDVDENAASGRQDALNKITLCAQFYLRELNLKGLKVGSLPLSLDFFKEQLTWLDVSGNGLSTLPDAVTNLKHLTVLIAGDNHLKKLPPKLSALTRLRHLHANNNQLDELNPDIGELPLRALCLSGNRLKELPDSISELTDLVCLHLSLNAFTTPPSVIFKLPQTSSVCLEGNLFTDKTLVDLKNFIFEGGETNCPEITFDVPSELASESKDSSKGGEVESPTQ